MTPHQQIAPKPMLWLSLILSCVWLGTVAGPLAATQSSAAEPLPALRTVAVKRKSSDSKWKPMPTRLVSDLKRVTSIQPARSRWGGRLDEKHNATGYFHVARHRGRATLVDPDGYGFLSVGCCSVNRLPSAAAEEALIARHGDAAGWARGTIGLLHGAGFNTLGCWSEAEAFADLDPPLATTPRLQVGVSFVGKLNASPQAEGKHHYSKSLLPVLHPAWPTFADQHIAERVRPLRNEPRVLGYFSDNELTFDEKALDQHLALPAGDPLKIAAEKWLAVRGSDAASISDVDRRAFFDHYVTAYFSTVAIAIKRHDPNHLYLGSRFHGPNRRQEALFRTAGPYLDVVSFNWYHQWTPDLEMSGRWAEWSGKPYLVTEWYAKAIDSGLSNQTGAGWLVKTQDDRAAFYQNFTLGLLEDPNCVGWHWFRYQDNDPQFAGADRTNRDANKGLVGNRYDPWKQLLQAASQLNERVYQLRDHLCTPQH